MFRWLVAYLTPWISVLSLDPSGHVCAAWSWRGNLRSDPRVICLLLAWYPYAWPSKLRCAQLQLLLALEAWYLHHRCKNLLLGTLQRYRKQANFTGITDQGLASALVLASCELS